MKRRLLLTLFGLFSFYFMAKSQSNIGITNRIEKSLNDYFFQYKPEKIYIQTDRSLYYYDDTLYFKTYLFNSRTFKLDTTACIILVDVLDRQLMVKQRYLVKSKNGVGEGSIVLNKYFVTGNCQLVAYSPIMKNYGDDYFFRKNFYFLGSPKIDSIFEQKLNLSSNEKHRLTRQAKKISLQADYFNFGESGIADLNIRIFNKLGQTVKTSGFYYKAKNKLHFKTNDEGLTSITAVNYTQSTKIELASGKKMKIPALDGKALKQTEKQNTLEIQIPPVYVDSRYLAVFSYGKLIKLRTIDNLAKTLSLPKDSLAQGINVLCLLDSKLNVLRDEIYFNPLKKRIILKFNENEDNLEIQNTLSESINFSMSISYELQELEKKETNILSQIYINQEVQQYTLYNPFRGLDPIIYQSKPFLPFNSILQKKWKTPKYVNSDSLVVKGKVIRFLSIGLPDKTIRLSRADDYYSTSVQQTDKKGQFQFVNIDGNDSSYYIIDVVKEQGRNNLYIDLDTAEYVYPAFKKELAFDVSLKRYRITPRNDALNVIIANSEVEELIKKRDKLRKKNSSGSIYGTPDYVIQMNESNSAYPSMKDLFVSIPGVSMNGQYPIIRGVSSLHGNNFPLVLVDNIPSSVDILTQLSPYDVDRIEILKSPSNLAMFGSRGANGVIAIFTRKGSFNTGFIKDFTIPGFAKERDFHRPNSQELSGRKAFTLYWKANVNLEANEKLALPGLEQYIGARLVIEGVSQSGKIIYFEKKIIE